MTGIFHGYKIALLDSTFFVSDFTDEVKTGLLNIKVYVSDTFNSEIEQYKKVLSPKRFEIYDNNVQFLNQNMRLNSLDLDSFGEQSASINNDVWGLISLLVSLNAVFVVLTANQLLMQRIILDNLNVDIYDLNKNQFCYSKDFLSIESTYSFSDVTWTGHAADAKVNENDVLFLKNGKRIRLGEELKSGLEANLYMVKGSDDSVAKIFKKDALSAGKFRNITKLAGINKDLDIKWALFPTSVLYHDVSCTIPVGFVEDFVKTDKNLDENPLLLGNLVNVPDVYLLKKQSYIVELCLRIVRQVCYLNTYGFYISDYNLGNFATIPNNDNVVQMWDTDSFGYDKFFGNFFSPDYVESNNHPKYDTSTKAGAIDISNDALYQFVFSVLSLGDSPISVLNGRFKYDNPNYFSIARKLFVPNNIWNHMADVFRGIKPPSAEALMKELLFACKQFEQNPETDKSFEQLFNETIPEFKDARREVVKKNRASSIAAAIKKSLEEETSTAQTKNNTTNNSNNIGSSASVSSNNSTGSKRKKQDNSRKKDVWILVIIAVIILIVIIGVIVSHSSNLPETIETSSSIDSLITSLTTTETGKRTVDASFFTSDKYSGYSKQTAIDEIESLGWAVECENENTFAMRKGYVSSCYCDEENDVVVLRISDGPGDEGIEMSGAYLSVNKTDIYLSKGESIDLQVSAYGNCPETFWLSVWFYSDNVVTKWGDWLDQDTAEIAITGNDYCEGYIRFYIKNDETSDPIGFTDIYITVN